VPGTIGDFAWGSMLYAADASGLIDVVGLGP